MQTQSQLVGRDTNQNPQQLSSRVSSLPITLEETEEIRRELFDRFYTDNSRAGRVLKTFRQISDKNYSDLTDILTSIAEGVEEIKSDTSVIRQGQEKAQDLAINHFEKLRKEVRIVNSNISNCRSSVRNAIMCIIHYMMLLFIVIFYMIKIVNSLRPSKYISRTRIFFISSLVSWFVFLLEMGAFIQLIKVIEVYTGQPDDAHEKLVEQLVILTKDCLIGLFSNSSILIENVKGVAGAAYRPVSEHVDNLLDDGKEIMDNYLSNVTSTMIEGVKEAAYNAPSAIAQAAYNAPSSLVGTLGNYFTSMSRNTLDGGKSKVNKRKRKIKARTKKIKGGQNELQLISNFGNSLSRLDTSNVDMSRLQDIINDLRLIVSFSEIIIEVIMTVIFIEENEIGSEIEQIAGSHFNKSINSRIRVRNNKHTNKKIKNVKKKIFKNKTKKQRGKK